MNASTWNLAIQQYLIIFSYIINNYQEPTKRQLHNNSQTEQQVLEDQTLSPTISLHFSRLGTKGGHVVLRQLRYQNIQLRISILRIHMSTCMQKPSIYKSNFNTEADPIMTTIIVLSVVLPLQILLMIFICMFNKYNKKFTIEPNTQDNQIKLPNHKQEYSKNLNSKAKQVFQYEDSNNRFEYSNRLASNKNKSVGDKDRHQGLQNNFQNSHSKPKDKKQSSEEQRSCFSKIIPNIEQIISKHASKNKLIICTLISVSISLAGIITLIISVLASEQALNIQLSNAQCVLNQTTNQFVKGNSDWVGLEYMVPNVTKLQLSLNSRVKATKNSLTSLLLNGTGAPFPIGFPNGTSIPNIITGTPVVSRSVETFIQARLRQWLFMNSTLSGSYRFPICQTTPISTIPHPLNDNANIQLNYMSSICNNLTQEVNLLVANGRAADNLLTLTTTVQNTKQSLNSNLNSYTSAISPVALRSKEYSSTFSNTNIDVNSQRSVPFIMLSLSIVSFISLIAYFIFQFCRFKKYTDNRQQYIELYNQNDPQNPFKYKSMKVKVTDKRLMIQAQNLSISQASQLSPQEMRLKQKTKIKQILRSGLFAHSKFTYAINTMQFLLIFVVGLSSISYIRFINTGIQSCQTFKQINSGKDLSSISQITNTQAQLLKPIQTCILNSTLSSAKFLETADTQTQLRNMEQFYKISQIYNSTTPINLLNSTSLQQIEVLKNYLLHMQTMPVKSQDFSILKLVQQLNTYTNGSSTISKQKDECGNTVLRDQYVHNVADCQYNLISYANQSLTTQPRCLQIPTYEGSGGSKQADLNDAQHTIQLNLTCPTILDFYNGTNPACFLGKRLALMRSAGCTSTAAEYNRRLRNLVRFSIETASYTNSYMQNLRNYFGVYSVLSTNMTQFFNGANTSKILNQFGTISNNIINKTSCSYVRTSVSNIYDTFCPSQNSISMVLYDSYAWMLISFGIIAAGWFSIIVWQMIAKTYMRSYLRQIGENQSDKLVFNLPNRFFRNNRVTNQRQQKNEKKDKSIDQYKRLKMKKLQLTEQNFNTQNNEDNNEIVKQVQHMNKYNMLQREDNSAIANQRHHRIRKQKAVQDNRNSTQLENIDIHIIDQPSKKIIQQNISAEKQHYKQSQQSSEKFSKNLTEQYEPNYNSNQQRLQTQKKSYPIDEHQNEAVKNKSEQQEKVNKNLNIINNQRQIYKQEQENKHRHQNQRGVIKNQQKATKERKLLDIKDNQQVILEKDLQNIFQTKQNEQDRNQVETVEKVFNQRYVSTGQNNRRGKHLQIQFTHEQQKAKKAPFFDSLESEMFNKQKQLERKRKMNSNQQARKVQSKNEMRLQNKNINPVLPKKNATKSITKIVKQARQNDRLKTVQMDQILKQTIDFVDLRNKNQPGRKQ